jgi:hypothetical protein
MRVWRALKGLGAVVLRDGVYLLPLSTTARDALEEQAQVIRSAGGTAHVLALEPVTSGQDVAFRRLFDRSAGYAALIERLQKLRVALVRRRGRTAAGALRVLRREFDALRATDYFAGAPAEQAAQLLSELEAQIAAWGTSGEPGARDGRIVRLDPRAYRGRTWATRARPWVDRLASAWLIKRFIDPRAKILWLTDIKRCPRTALGFDFDGATFSHIGARVTFEHLLASFGLEDDPALMRIGRLVHCLDVGGAPVPEAQGLAAILAGARTQLTNDNRLHAEANRVFDHLYRSYQEE